MRILGISAFYHDGAAALVEDARIVAAAQEERFTRKKHDSGFPRHAVEYCLRECGGSLAEVDHVAFHDKPFLKFERLLETYQAFAPRGFILQGSSVVAQGEVVPEVSTEETAQGLCPLLRLEAAPPLYRAPSEPCRQRLLRITVRRGRGADHGWGGRVG